MLLVNIMYKILFIVSHLNSDLTVLKTQTSTYIKLYTESGWTVGEGLCIRDTKPTISSGIIPGLRDLTNAEVSAFNTYIEFEPEAHCISVRTTDSTIATLSGKFIKLVFA